jgi:hypothetical protein
MGEERGSEREGREEKNKVAGRPGRAELREGEGRKRRREEEEKGGRKEKKKKKKKKKEGEGAREEEKKKKEEKKKEGAGHLRGKEAG